MIPRHQRIYFVVLLLGCIGMAIYLFHLRTQRSTPLDTASGQAPMVAPADAPLKDVKFVLANDASGSLKAAQASIAMRGSVNSQTRALLVALAAEYAKPLSQHPLSAGPSVDDVFLMPLRRAEPEAEDEDAATEAPPQIAVVNLDPAFAQSHPSGIEPEMLTVRSMVATLHENFPQIKQVRFLVDGRQRDTLAGHASLMRVYDAAEDTSDPVNGSIQ